MQNRQQAIAWTSDGQVLCRHIMWLRQWIKIQEKQAALYITNLQDLEGIFLFMWRWSYAFLSAADQITLFYLKTYLMCT